MDGLKSLMMVLTVVLAVVALYGAYVANFGMVGGIGTMDGSVSLLVAVFALWGCTKMMCHGDMKKK